MFERMITILLISAIFTLIMCNTSHSAEVSTYMHVGATIAPYDHITISPSASVSQETNNKVEPVVKKETVKQNGQTFTLITIYS